jgi:hypothetical protein
LTDKESRGQHAKSVAHDNPSKKRGKQSSVLKSSE